jgi:SAM-dependent methyltransferase
MKQRERLKKASPNGNRLWRYNWAQAHIEPTDTVLDVGCGSGFGREFLKCGKYIGVDYTEIAEPDIIADANEWTPDFEFDIFIGFESIEHIKNTENYVNFAKQAKKHIFITCPASETLSFNPFHVYDFTTDQIKELFEDENWEQVEFLTRLVKKGKVLQQVHHFKRK